MTSRTWIIFIAIVAVLFGGLIYVANRNNIDVSSVDANTIQSASENSGNVADHVFGSTNAKVVLIEYGDYQCPGCGSAYSPIKTVTEKYKDNVTFIFRNFPLTTIHPNARAAAGAAEAAGLLGKYWEMHNILYENQSGWENSTGSARTDLFAGYAAQIGLDKNAFLDKLSTSNADINRKISFDQAIGKKINVSGTPTFYLNGKQVDQVSKDGQLVAAGTSGAEPVWSNADDFDKLIIQPALKEAGVTIPPSTN